jgi:hypothetical protein
VRRAANHAELEKLLTEEPFQDFPFLYQRQISGQARGVFALYGQGEAVAFFAHRRLREKPPEGGVSVLCESTALDPTLLRLARELLDDAGWHGVAMVEFKVSELEGPFLMEVNTRFWGSLQLAIDADIDFPTLLLQQELGEPLPVAPHYHLGRRLRWFLGDLDRLYLLISGYRGYGTRAVLRGLLDFILPRPFATRHEIFRWSDPRPAVRELQHYVSALGTE